MTESDRVPVIPAHSGWSAPVCIGFRFLFAYLVLFILPFPIGTIPGTDKLATAYAGPWDRIVPWTGEHILHLKAPVSTVQNGSGDKVYDYVVFFLMIVLAALVALVWSLLTRRREHSTLHEWLRVYVRY